VGMNQDVVRPGVDGFLPASDAEWSEALVELIENAPLRARLGEAARDRVVTGYSQRALFPRYLTLLERFA
jgi:glycosyltransferase involved in cell wall biosynthesis